MDDIKEAGDVKAPLLTKDQIEDIDELESWTERVQSPLQQLEHRLHNWVAYLIMPLFAFSNAGVSFQGDANLDTFLGGVIVVSLVVGKLLGITLFSLLSIKLKLAELPEGVNFMQIIGTALLAGVGFTMSIFVANLAFYDNALLLDSAKAGILAGSFLAGLSGYLVLRFGKQSRSLTAQA